MTIAKAAALPWIASRISETKSKLKMIRSRKTTREDRKGEEEEEEGREE